MANVRATAQIDTFWLRNYLTEEEIDTLDENSASDIRAIVNWYGSIAGSLVINMNQSWVPFLQIDYK